MSRMRMLAAATVAGGVSAAAAQDELADLPGTDIDRLAFEVAREGSPIGRHEIRFERNGEELVVDVRIDLEVEFLAIPMFEYRHHNREVWRDGRLVRIDTVTDADGKEYRVTGRASAQGFVVEAAGERRVLPRDIMPTSYWHPATPQRSLLLNTQTGEPEHVSIERRPGCEKMAGTKCYAVSGDLALELAYGPQGRLADIRFESPSDGSLIDYRLVGAEY